MSVLRELLAVFDIDVKGTEKLGKAHEQIQNFEHSLENFAKAFVGFEVVKELKEFVEGQVEAGAAAFDTSKRLGIATGDMQRFAYAASLTGVGSEQAATALKFLNKAVGNAVLGNGEAVSAFSNLGVAVKDAQGNVKPLSALIPEVADGLSKLGSVQERTAYLTKLFGRAGAALGPVFEGGAAGVHKLSEEFDALGGGMSEEFVKDAKETDDQLIKLKFSASGLSSKVTALLLPAVNKMVDLFIKWSKTAQDYVKDTNIMIAVMAALGATAIVSLAKASGAIAGLAASLWEIALPVGLIVLLALAFEDLYTFIQGGDSLIGAYIEKFEGLEEKNKIAKELRDTFKALSDFFTADGPGITGTLESWGFHMSTLQKMIEAVIKSLYFLASLASTVAASVEAIAKAAGEFLTPFNQSHKESDAAVDTLNNKWGGLQKTFTKLDQPGWNASTETTPEQAAAFLPPPEFAGPPLPPKTEIEINNENHVTVNGASDPAKTAAQVGAEMARQNEANQDAFQALSVKGAAQ